MNQIREQLITFGYGTDQDESINEILESKAELEKPIPQKESINEILESKAELEKPIPQKKSLGTILFSFEGRISRFEFWGKAIPILFIYTIIGNMIVSAEIESYGQPVISNILLLISLWSIFAVTAKRLHDRDLSSSLLLTLFIPFLNIVCAFWLIIEIWFRKGTEGENKYGM